MLGGFERGEEEEEERGEAPGFLKFPYSFFSGIVERKEREKKEKRKERERKEKGAREKETTNKKELKSGKGETI